MVNETRDFGLATLLTVVGLVVMLWGVSLDNGMAMNEPMIVGGLIVAAGIGLITVAVMRLEGTAEAH
jgi:hypothetical protein